MPGMRITIDDAQVRAMLARAPGAVQTKLRQLIEAGAIDVQREMRIKAPVAVTGQLRGSIRYTVTAGQYRAEINPNTPYAESVEYGSHARYVSVAEGTPLRAWAKQKGINPYALQKSIARKGTKPHPFVGPTYDAMKPKVERDIAAGIALLVEELNRG